MHRPVEFPRNQAAKIKIEFYHLINVQELEHVPGFDGPARCLLAKMKARLGKRVQELVLDRENSIPIQDEIDILGQARLAVSNGC